MRRNPKNKKKSGQWHHQKVGLYDTYPEGRISQEAFAEALEAHGAVEVTPMDAYTEIFHLGDHLIQRKGEYNDGKGELLKGNPIAYYSNNDEPHGHFRIMLEDTFEEDLRILQDADFAILNGVTYLGRKNLAAHQSQMCAMIFDIDGVLDVTLPRIYTMANVGYMPLPQYIALSGHGVHFYYVFDDPIALYPNVKVQLKALKYELTRILWWDRLSCDEKVQYQGINQGFRALGSKTKIKGKHVRVFQVDPHPVTLQRLNECVSEENRVDTALVYRPGKMTLREAAEAYPDWYQRRIVQGLPKGHYHVFRAVYDWWLRTIKTPEKISYHHRYFSIMCLYIFAAKCDVSKEEVDKDAADLVPYLNGIRPDAPFTMDDVRSASDCYDDRFRDFPRRDIEKVSGVTIEPQKRNGNPQDMHLKIARFTCDLKHPDGSWRNTEGAPTKQEKVVAYAAEHPDATPTQAARDLGISRTTVYKWWPQK